MASLETLPVVVGIGGAVLIWAGIKNKRPDDAIKLALKGQDPNGARPISNLASAPPAGAIPSESLPGTPQGDSDARTDPPGFTPGPNTYVVPILPGEAREGGGVY